MNIKILCVLGVVAVAGLERLNAQDATAPTRSAPAELSRRLDEATALAGKGTADSAAQAAAIFRELIEAGRKAGAPDIVAPALEGLVALVEDVPQMLKLYREAADAREALGDGAGAARNLVRLGEALNHGGQVDAARTTLLDARQRFQALGDRRGEAGAVSTLGDLHYRMTQYDEAVQRHEEAVALLGADAAPDELIPVLNNLAIARQGKSQHREALELYRRTHELAQKLPGVDGQMWQAVTLTNMGTIHMELGETEKAEEPLEAAIAIAKSAHLPRTVTSGILVYRSRARRILGENGAALDDLLQARAIVRGTGDLRREIDLLIALGDVYRELGDWEQALFHHRAAWDMGREARADRAPLLQRIAVDQLLLGRLPDAAQSMKEAFEAVRSLGSPMMEARFHATQGDIEAALGNTDAARESFAQAIALHRRVGSRGGEVMALTSVGRLEARLGRTETADERLRQALELARATGFRAGESQVLYDLAALHRRAGRLDEARRAAETGLEIVESMRGAVWGHGLRTSLLASTQDHYEQLVDLLLRLDGGAPGRHAAVALEVSERARARSLLDALRERRADVRPSVDASLLAKESQLRGQLTERLGARGGVDASLITAHRQTTRRLRAREGQLTRLLERSARPAEIDVVNKEIGDLLTEYHDVQARIRAAGPRYAALIEPRAARVEEIQRDLLDADTALVEYFLGEERSHAWLVTPEAVEVFALPPRREIEAAARRFYEALRARAMTVDFETPARRERRVAEADAALPEAARALSAQVLAPVAARLRAKRLVVVSHGALQYIPFAALPVARTGAAETPLLVHHEIVHAPSASVLLELRRDARTADGPHKTIAVMADPVFGSEDPRAPKRRAAPADDEDRYPRLPGSAAEARSILRLVPAADALSAVGFAANLQTATSPELARYRMVHFATHAFVDSERPDRAGLVLSRLNERGERQEGVLRLEDVYSLNLDADLVVLSACQTALGREIRGEGMLGLTRGFMYAGGRRVVASLWNSSDLATSDLMARFYGNMLKGGQVPAAALRAAQLSLAQSSRWKSPYYWAGFIVQGDWR